MSDNYGLSRRDKKKSSPLVGVAAGGAVSAVIFFLLIIIFSLIYLKIGSDSYLVSGMASGALSGFAGGFVTALRIKEKGALYSLASGGASSLVCGIVIFLINKSSAGMWLFVLAAEMIIFSFAGGITAVYLKRRKKY